MKRRAWKWIFGISLTLFILLGLFTVGIWALGNATAAMAGAIMSYTDPDTFGYRYMPFGEFMSNFVGSPMFYVCLLDISALLAGIIGLIATKREKNGNGAAETKT